MADLGEQNLSEDQAAKRAAIVKSAAIAGAVAGIVAGLLALWLLGGRGAGLRYGGGLLVALAVGFLVYRASFGSGAKAAACGKCGAVFSLSRSGHDEVLTGSAPKTEETEQPDKSVKVTSWTEDRFDVTDRYTCAKCGDVTLRNYKTTRRRDESSVVRPFVEPAAAAQAARGAPVSMQAPEGPNATGTSSATGKGSARRR